MIAFLEPLGLSALAALGIPLLVHLRRRAPLPVIRFSALRYLDSRVTASRRRWRLHDPVLYLLRSLLVATVALLLAVPVWRRPAPPSPPWVLVIPGVAPVVARAAAVPQGAVWHWLAPGFPAFAEGAPAPGGSTPGAPASDAAAPARDSLWSLLRELDAQLPAATPVVVLAPGEVAGLDGERPRFERRVDWRIVPEAGSAPGPASDPEPMPHDSLPRVTIRYDAAGGAELPVARAIATAWQSRGAISAIEAAALPEPIPAGDVQVIWLADPSAPALRRWLEHGGTALVSRPAPGPAAPLLADAAGSVYVREQRRGGGRLLIIGGPLTVATLPELADPDFPDRIERALAQPRRPPTRAAGRAAAPAQVAPATAGITPPYRASTSLDGWLATLAAVLFAAERLWAGRRRRAV